MSPTRPFALSPARAFSALRALLNRAQPPEPPALSGATRLTDLIKGANRWREQYNPLRGLDITRAISLRESFLRGEYADIQWTYHHIEQSDPDLFALITRRISAMGKLDWDIRICDQDKPGFDQAIADKQAAFLRETYDRIDNLQEAFAHLAGATFRGFALLEKHGDAGGPITHLEPCDAWNIVRDGYRGEWRLNLTGQSTTYRAIEPQYNIQPASWIIRAVPRHLDWIALLKFVRANLCEKDWDGWIEIYGVPGATVIGPPNIPPGKETEYETSAQAVAEGGTGYLPNGSDIRYPSEVRGDSPFRDRLTWLREQLILAGTGGQLTMLSQPTGLGQGASGEHADVFRDIAIAEGLEISEIFQRQIDKPLLASEFPGQPALAYFRLCAEEETDVGAVVAQVCQLKTAGYAVSVEELSEKSGYQIETAETRAGEWANGRMGDQVSDNPSDPSDPSSPSDPESDEESNPESNGEPLLNTAATPLAAPVADTPTRPLAISRFYAALAQDMQPVQERLARILQINDPVIMAAKLQALMAELPQLAKDLLADPASAAALQPLLAESVAAGVAQAAQPAVSQTAQSAPRT